MGRTLLRLGNAANSKSVACRRRANRGTRLSADSTSPGARDHRFVRPGGAGATALASSTRCTEARCRERQRAATSRRCSESGFSGRYCFGRVSGCRSPAPLVAWRRDRAATRIRRRLGAIPRVARACVTCSRANAPGIGGELLARMRPETAPRRGRQDFVARLDFATSRCSFCRIDMTIVMRGDRAGARPSLSRTRT